MKKLWLMLAMMVCFLTSCSDEPSTPTPKPEEVKTEITIDSGIVSNGLSFDASDGEQSVSFSVNANWTLSIASTTSGATWCKASATSGSKGTANVKFTVTENTDYDDRSVSVTIKAGTVSKTFTITQKGADALLITTSKYEVAQEGGQIEIEVKANINYQMEISETAKDWITESKSKSRALTTYKHKLNIAMNEETEKREGEITFNSGDKVETVKVYQAGGSIILLTQNEYTISDAGETVSVDIKSNIEFGVQMPEVDWITDEASSRGMSSHTLRYVVAPNEGYDSRTAEIIFYDKNSDLTDTLKVVQAQKDAIIISKKEYEVKAEGETIEVKLSANVDFEVTMPEMDWISQTESRSLKEHTLYFKVAENTSEISRSAEIVFTNKDSQLSDTLVVVQQSYVSIIGIPEEELDGWKEGFLINDEILFVTTEDSVGHTIAYFNKLNKKIEDGLVIEFDSLGILSQIYDYEYIHLFNFSEDSLYVTSVPADTTSTIPIKHKGIAFNYKEECNIEAFSRVSNKTMDRLAMYYFLHSTGKKIEISDKEVWQTVGQAIIEKAIGEGVEKGVAKLAGKVAGVLVGTCLFVYDVVSLYNEVSIYTFLGHARLNVTGDTFNPKEFTVEFENINTLPSPSKYGDLKPYEYECGVLLDGKKHIGPYSFKTGEHVHFGTYKMPQLANGVHSLIPYILHKNSGVKVIGKELIFLVRDIEKPKYSVKTKDIYYKKGKVKIALDVEWTPVNNSLIEYQGISFTKPDGSMFCLNLSNYHGGNAPHINDTSGEYSRDDFEIDYNNFLATSNLKIEYWVTFADLLGRYSILLENYQIIYDRKPSFVISNITETDRGSYSGDSGYDSYVSYTYDYIVDGGLFIDKIYEKYGANWTSSGTERLILNEVNDNTSHIRKGVTIKYASKYTGASPISFYALLKNENKHQFNQGMTFQGGSLSVNNGTRSVIGEYIETVLFPMPLIVVNE